MESANLSRRSLLQAIAAVIGTVTSPFGWAEVAHAMDEAHAASQAARDAKTSFLSAAEAADVEAVAAQIIPTDDTPGAREAGVVYFIDRALARSSPPFRRRIANDIPPLSPSRPSRPGNR